MDIDPRDPKTKQQYRRAAIVLAVIVVVIIIAVILLGGPSSCAFDWAGGCTTDGPASFQRYLGAWPNNRYGRDFSAPVQQSWAENALRRYQVDSLDACESDCAADTQGCSGYSFNASDPSNLQCAHWPPPGAASLVAPDSSGDATKMTYGYRPGGPPDPLASCPDSAYAPQGSSVTGSDDIPPGCWASDEIPDYTIYTGPKAISTGDLLWHDGHKWDAAGCADKCSAWDGCAYWTVGYGTPSGDANSGVCSLYDDSVKGVPTPRDAPGTLPGYVGVLQS